MFSAALLLAFIAVTSAYKQGPPIDSEANLCQHMIPDHGAAPQDNEKKVISFALSQSCFKESQSVKVEVTTSKDTIEGFFMQARTDTFENATKSYGEFRTYVKHSSQYDCSSGKKNAVGHKDDEPKVKKMNIYWMAPSTGLQKDVHIGGTFVLHKKEFFINVYVTIKYNANCQQLATGESSEKAANSASVKTASALLSLVLFAIMKLL